MEPKQKIEFVHLQNSNLDQYNITFAIQNYVT